jgi:UDP-glucose 4-epimerase
MKFDGKKVLVTGSSGFIGGLLSTRLESAKADLVKFDRPQGDIRLWDDVKHLEADIVYHLAALAFVPFAFENPRETYETNVTGTLNILELCRNRDVKKIIFTSSYIYGVPKYLPIDEKHPVNPTNPYMHSKMMGEKLCESYSEYYGIECVILRPFNVYGYGQDKRFLVPSIIHQIFEKKKIELENPRPKRDFLYVDDLIDAYIKAIRCDSRFEIFNIGYGESYSVGKIVDSILRIYGEEMEVHYSRKERENEVMDILADAKKAESELGWKPKTNLEEGLRKTLYSYRKEFVGK